MWFELLSRDYDADAAAERVAALGGSVFMGPHDTPYGRLVAAADCTGAPFNLMDPTRTVADPG
ncbi:MAG: hypothetical protein IT195_07005 [Microthrixaceae bacterium]|nr:hypothetical protein [Microthrixaceae bacterium]